jgi:hypothetical protein
LKARLICVLFILVIANALAQESARVQLNGKILSDVSNLEGIYVINLKTEATVITPKDGSFSIFATVEDTLIFSGSQFKRARVGLTSKDFEKELFVVKLDPIINYLDEVVINRYGNINAVSLGIIPRGQKSYTPAERKLRTATSLDPSANAGGMVGGSVSADPLLNWISGRTSMLKKELEVEGKEMGLRQLENMFDKAFFVGKLKIPSDYVKGFQYYLVENDRFVKILKLKNKANIEFVIGDFAIQYNKILADDKK